MLGDATPEGQDLDQEEGGSSGDTDCHDTHPNADSGKLREEVLETTNAQEKKQYKNRGLPPENKDS